MHGVPWLAMPAIARATPISLMPLRRRVVPGTADHFAVTANPLFLLDFSKRDVTLATPFHGVCPMVAPVLRPCSQIDVRAGGLKSVFKLANTLPFPW